MHIRPLGALGLFAIAASACITVGFVGAMRPTSLAAFLFFCAWLVFPHLAMAAVLLVRERKGMAPGHWDAIAILVSIGGVLFLADLMFWHTDAQGAIAVLMTPLLQSIALAVLLALSALVSRRARTKP